jgi:hypothetical protein
VTYGTVENVAELIPFMLAALVANDGGIQENKNGKMSRRQVGLLSAKARFGPG